MRDSCGRSDSRGRTEPLRTTLNICEQAPDSYQQLANKLKLLATPQEPRRNLKPASKSNQTRSRQAPRPWKSQLGTLDKSSTAQADEAPKKGTLSRRLSTGYPLFSIYSTYSLALVKRHQPEWGGPCRKNGEIFSFRSVDPSGAGPGGRHCAPPQAVDAC